jgi:hypothetical protein
VGDGTGEEHARYYDLYQVVDVRVTLARHFQRWSQWELSRNGTQLFRMFAEVGQKVTPFFLSAEISANAANRCE